MGKGLPIRTVSENLIRNTKKKLHDVLGTISTIEEEDFPHEHSRDALAALYSIFSQRLDTILTLSTENESSVINRVCQEALETIHNFLPLLGFILRSTHTRNAFELNGPILRLVRQALGDEAKLILSSEWDFSPFTLLPPALDNRLYVMIGMPASESANSLTIPLAGHELGHSVWSQQRLQAKFGPTLENAIVDEILINQWVDFNSYFPEIEDEDRLRDLVGRQYWKISWQWALCQLEELYCDFLGVGIFGASYLHAFAYLLAPSLGGRRSEHYPNTVERAKAIQRAADHFGTSVSPRYHEQFQNLPYDGSDPHTLLLEIADQSVQTLIPRVLDEAHSFTNSHGLLVHSPDKVEAIKGAFEKFVPATDAGSLANIVNAGWDVYIGGVGAWAEKYPQLLADPASQERVLNDLILKTVEVFEIEQRLLP